MSDLLVKYLRNSKSFRVVQKFLASFNGLQMGLLDMDGRPIPADKDEECFFCGNLPIGCSDAPAEAGTGGEDQSTLLNFISQAAETQKVVSFSGQGGAIVFLVPVIYKDQAVCLLYLQGKDGRILLPNNQHAMIALVQDMLRHIIEEDFVSLKDYEGTEQSSQRKVMNRIMRFVCNNYQDYDLTLNRVASANNISYHYLSHLFKKELQTTFTDYLNNIRLTAAVKLLKARNLTVSQVCFFCGYKDPGYFSKVFKKRFGDSPVIVRSRKYKSRTSLPGFKSLLKRAPAR